MANLKDDNRVIRLTSSTIESPESKEHLISYSKNTKRDIERLKTYINDVSVNALKTLTYSDGFDKDGVEDGISGETVISLLGSTVDDGSVFYDETNIRSKTVYESLKELERLINLIVIPEDSNAELAGTINDLRDKLTKLKNSTLGEESGFDPTVNPSLGQHLYELISQCFTVIDNSGDFENSLSVKYENLSNTYTPEFSLNIDVPRGNVSACSETFNNLSDELAALYNNIAGVDCADFEVAYNSSNYCFINNNISNIKEFCEASADKVCELNSIAIDHEDRIAALEGQEPVSVNDATETVKGIVKIASTENIRGAVKIDSDGVSLCLTPGGFLDFLEGVTVVELKNTSSPFSTKFMSGYKKAMNVCSINELDDVDAVSPDNGYVLKWSDSDNKWIAGPDNTSLGSVTSVNGDRGDVVLDATRINTVGSFFEQLNPNVNIVLLAIKSILDGLAEVASSGLGEDVEIGGSPQNYSATAANVASHLNGIDIALGELENNLTIPNASEEERGIAELASEAETNIGEDDERIVTPLKLKKKLDISNYFRYAETINSSYTFNFPILGGSVFKVEQGSDSFGFGNKTLKRNDILFIKTTIESENYLNTIEGNNASFVIESTNSILDQVSVSWNEVLNKPSFGTAASYDVGTSAGQIPTIQNDGKLPGSILPSFSNSGGGGVETFNYDVQGTSSALTYISAQFTINPSKDVKSIILCNVVEGKRTIFAFSQSLDSFEVGKQIEFLIMSPAEEGSVFFSKARTTLNEDVELNVKGGESVIYTKINATTWSPQVNSSGYIKYDNFKTIEEPNVLNQNTRTYDIYPSGRKNIIYLKPRSGGAINVVYDLAAKDLGGKYSYGDNSSLKEFKFVDSTGSNKTSSFIRYYNENNQIVSFAIGGRSSDTFTLQCLGKVTSTSNTLLTGKLIWRLLD